MRLTIRATIANDEGYTLHAVHAVEVQVPDSGRIDETDYDHGAIDAAVGKALSETRSSLRSQLGLTREIMEQRYPQRLLAIEAAPDAL